jgi:aspartate oxidase
MRLALSSIGMRVDVGHGRSNMSKKTKILILGGGFGGVYTALRLDKKIHQITRTNTNM